MSERVQPESTEAGTTSPDVSAPNSESSRTMEAAVERLKANLVKEDRKLLALQRTEMLRTATTETLGTDMELVSDWVQNETRIAIAGFEVTGVRARSADRLRQSWAHFLATIAGSSTRIEILTTLSYDADLILTLRINCIGRGGREIADKRCQQAARFVRSMQETILPDFQHGSALNRPIIPQFSEIFELKRTAGTHEYSKASFVPGIAVESLLRALQRSSGSAVMVHFVRHPQPALRIGDVGSVGGRGKPDLHGDEVSQTARPMFAARVFVGQLSAPDHCLMEVAGNCLFCDGQRVEKTRCVETQVVRSLSGPEESGVYDLTGLMNLLPVAVAVGDRPGFRRLPGILAPWSGTTGTDAPYGITVDPLRSRPISSTPNARCSHLFVCGKTGTGKSSLLLNRSLFDIQQGRGICVIDPHGSLNEDILSRMPAERAGDVIVLDPGEPDRPVGFNPLVIAADSALSYRRERDRTVSDLLMDVEHAFKEQWAHISGPVCETYMRSTLSILMGIAQPSPQEMPHLGLIRPFFSYSEFRKRMQARLLGHEPMLDDFIREAESATRDLNLRDVSGYITSRFNRFLCEAGMHNMICQRRSVDLTKAIQNKQIILCHLRRGELGEHSARLLASMLVSRLRRAIMAAGRSENVDPFCLYADECQLFADGRIASLLNEGRKFGLSITLATQHLNNLQGDVVSAILGNVAGTVLFRQSPKDAEFFSQSLMAAPASHLVQLSNFEAVVVDSVSLGQQSAQFRIPRPAAIRNPNQSKRVREISRLVFGTAESQIESELDETRIALLGNA